MKVIGTILLLVGLGYVLTGLAQMIMAAAWTPERLVIFGIGTIVVAVRVYRGQQQPPVESEKTNG